MRLENFTSYHILLQSGRFDTPNRQLQNIADAWGGATATSSQSDVKELVPEFFYLPEVFTNGNNIDFGTRTDGIKLGDVGLPPWAKNSPEKFIKLHVRLLRANMYHCIHHWIDLIFGCKQSHILLKAGQRRQLRHATYFFMHLTRVMIWTF